jgi:hypothetical protein
MIKLDESEPHVRRSVLASRARSGCVGGSVVLSRFSDWNFRRAVSVFIPWRRCPPETKLANKLSADAFLQAGKTPAARQEVDTLIDALPKRIAESAFDSR